MRMSSIISTEVIPCQAPQLQGISFHAKDLMWTSRIERMESEFSTVPVELLWPRGSTKRCSPLLKNKLLVFIRLFCETSIVQKYSRPELADNVKVSEWATSSWCFAASVLSLISITESWTSPLQWRYFTACRILRWTTNMDLIVKDVTVSTVDKKILYVRIAV